MGADIPSISPHPPAPRCRAGRAGWSRPVGTWGGGGDGDGGEGGGGWGVGVGGGSWVMVIGGG